MTPLTSAQEVVLFLNFQTFLEAIAIHSPIQLKEYLHLVTVTFQYQGKLMDIHQGQFMVMKGPHPMRPEQVCKY